MDKIKFKFDYKGKKIEINAGECKTLFQKFRGLMFRKSPFPLLFYFNKTTRESIHSFFCKPFYAIWFLDNNIVDEKFIKPWVFWIQPKKKFNKLLEIPINNKNFWVFSRRASSRETFK